MFFQKTFISIALSGMITPGIMQTTNITNQVVQSSSINATINNKKNSLGHLEPFNPADVYSYDFSKFGDYFAYYSWGHGMPFPPLHQGNTEGYILQMGQPSMVYLKLAYFWAKNNGVNPLGGMLSYMTKGYFGTPVQGLWPLDDDLFNSTISQQLYVIARSFAYSKLDFFDMMMNAINAHQTLDFFFYTETTWNHDWAKVMVANAETGKNLTSAWYEGP